MQKNLRRVLSVRSVSRCSTISLIGLLTLLSIFGKPADGASTQDSQPNILLILTDDQGWGDLGAYGATDLQTPAMDALVASGMRLDNFYANCPVCSPTRAALLAGLIPDKVGVPGVIRTQPEDNWGFLSPTAVLLPKPLNAAGYHTALIGKWHLGLKKPSRPNDHGFDLFHGFLGDMMDDYWTHTRHGMHYMRLNEQDIRPQGHATDVFTDWAVDYVKSRAASDQPWFCMLAYNAPHFPVQPPEEWLERVLARDPGIDHTRAKLVAFIEHLDAGIGRVITALAESDQAQNTLIVFTSDNGGHKGSKANCGPHRGFKQQMFEGGIAVPFCAVWPGKITAGTRSEVVAQTSDLYPTFCAAAGATFDHHVDGRSILPTLLGTPQDIDRDLIWVRREGGRLYQGQDYYAVRRGPWKLLQNNPFERYQLYNLYDDPLEQADVADLHPQLVEQLSLALRRHIQQAAQVPWQEGNQTQSGD
jgi:arylsulfatase A-like enzyme